MLLRENSQFKGIIYILDGHLVHCEYDGGSGLQALYSVVFQDMEKDDYFRFVVEPEVVDARFKNFNLNFEKFKNNVSKLYGDFKESERLRPPDSVKLLIRDDFVRAGEEVSAMEFRVLCTLTEFNKVGDIYRNSDLMSFEITRALVSLRKKSALKVIKAI